MSKRKKTFRGNREHRQPCYCLLCEIGTNPKHHKYDQQIKQLSKNMRDIEPEINAIVQKHFFEMI